MTLAFHHVNVFTWRRIDHNKLILVQGEVADILHRRRLERAGSSACLKHTVRMALDDAQTSGESGVKYDITVPAAIQARF